MNFFKSILSDDPDPPNPSSSTRDLTGEPAGEFSGESSGGWSFDGLLKTLASQSESVIEIYTRDLKEFGSGLQKEIKELPNEIDTVLKSTKEIIVKKSSNLDNVESIGKYEKNDGKYSRFERVLRGLENDVNTYVKEVEDDDEEYEKWKLGLGFEEKKKGNERVNRFYKELVPRKVSEEEFWGRYNYRVYKLRQQEEMRERIVKRVISGNDDDEELSWDVDDDDDDDGGEIEGEKRVIKGVLSDEKSVEKGIESKDGVFSDEKSVEKGIESKDGVFSDEKSVEKGIEGNLSGEKSVEKEVKGKEGILSDEKEIEGNEEVVSDEKSVKGEIKGNEEKIVGKGLEGNEKGLNEGMNVGLKGEGEVVNEKNVDEAETKGKEKGLNEKEVVEVDRKGSEQKVVETGSKGNEKVVNEKIVEADTKGKEKGSGEEKIVKVDNKGLGKSGDVLTVEEDDMGWDEIEDVDSGDEKKVSGISGSQDKVDLRKRPSVTEDDEDLSWDIEDDDDEPVAKP